MKRRTIFGVGAIAVAALLAMASFGSALAQQQPGFGPGGMMGGRGVSGQGYGPGMMGGYWPQTAVAPTVTADKAQQIAQQWLDQYQPGSATEAPDTFPGYYTVHITNDGAITGMLSVNAYTGQVWYHTWHGAFVAAA